MKLDEIQIGDFVVLQDYCCNYYLGKVVLKNNETIIETYNNGNIYTLKELRESAMIKLNSKVTKDKPFKNWGGVVIGLEDCNKYFDNANK